MKTKNLFKIVILLFFIFFISSISSAKEPFTISHPEFLSLSGAKIKTTLLIPKVKPPEDGFPVLLLEGPDTIFAALGYVTLQYHELVQRLRAGSAPDEELKKVVFKDMLDYLSKNAPVNLKKIAVLGGSGGGVMALRLTSLDSEISASVAMAAPFDFKEALMPGNSVKFLSSLFGIFMISSYISQKPQWLTKEEIQQKSQNILPLATALIYGKNVKNVFEKLSSSYQKPQLEKIKTPTFLNYSWDDLLVPLEDAYLVYNKLQCAKKIILSEGHHGSDMRPEELSFQLSKTIMWLEHYLKSVPNGIDLEPKFIASLPNSSNPNRKGELFHLYFSEFPPEETFTEDFYLHENRIMNSEKPTKDETDFTIENAMQASGFEDPIITRLIEMLPVLAPALLSEKQKEKKENNQQNLEQFQKIAAPILTDFFNKIKGLVRPASLGTYYDSSPLKENKIFMGSPLVKIFVSSDNKKFQINFKLYDINEKGQAHLITRVPFTYEGEKIKEEEIQLVLSPKFYIFKKGHKIRLTITSTDFPYVLPCFNDASFVVHHGLEAPLLKMPFIDKKDWQAPEKIKKVSVEKKEQNIKISWEPVKDKDVIGYFIYRRDTETKNLFSPSLQEDKKDKPDKKSALAPLENLIKKFAKIKFADDLRQIVFVPATKTFYEDVSAINNKEEIAYSVSALDKEGNEGAVSELAGLKK